MEHFDKSHLIVHHFSTSCPVIVYCMRQWNSATVTLKKELTHLSSKLHLCKFWTCEILQHHHQTTNHFLST